MDRRKCRAVSNVIASIWGVPSLPSDEQTVYKLLGISLGLSSIFNDSDEAERRWMTTYHLALEATPLEVVQAGGISEVLNLVNDERGLR